MSDSLKLKPCPFCGSENVKITDIGEGKNDHYFLASCQNPECGSGICFGQKTKEEFIEAYNRRA